MRLARVSATDVVRGSVGHSTLLSHEYRHKAQKHIAQNILLEELIQLDSQKPKLFLKSGSDKFRNEPWSPVDTKLVMSFQNVQIHLSETRLAYVRSANDVNCLMFDPSG